MDVLVTYDINTTPPAGVRRLARVAQVCEGYGVRVQYSVFECRVSPTKFEMLITDLRTIIDRGLDSINFYRFDGAIPKARLSLGRAVGHELGKPWVI